MQKYDSGSNSVQKYDSDSGYIEVSPFQGLFVYKVHFKLSLNKYVLRALSGVYHCNVCIEMFVL